MLTGQVLTTAQMRDAEQRVFDAGVPVFELMQTAAGGAAEWIRRIAAGRRVTVLCGPGNNGGDGYVIAHRMRAFGNEVSVIAPMPAKTDAAKQALSLWDGPVLTSGGKVKGDLFVDCLFGSGLTRPLTGEHALLLRDLAARHSHAVAVDVPSGIASDTGALLNERLPVFDVTLALGAWKFAHWSLPGREKMGVRRLVPIGIDPVDGAARLVSQPSLTPPESDTHKYRRGLGVIVGGVMPGAARLASEAAMRAGAGYIKLLADADPASPNPALVTVQQNLSEALADKRICAVLVGPGLGRDGAAQERLRTALDAHKPCVLDADALVLLKPAMLAEDLPALATPHDGELEALCRNFSVIAEGRRHRAIALARAAKMVVMAKGADTVIAAPDGRLALAPPTPSWLSVAGSGDVLAGIALSRMATGREPFEAACEAAWLHGEAARICGPAFTPLDLAQAVPAAIARCL